MAWVSGVSEDGREAGTLYYDVPPVGWLQDPFGGTWYPLSDPFVRSGWGRGAPIDLVRAAPDVPPDWTPTLPPGVVPNGFPPPGVTTTAFPELPSWALPVAALGALWFLIRNKRGT